MHLDWLTLTRTFPGAAPIESGYDAYHVAAEVAADLQLGEGAPRISDARIPFYPYVFEMADGARIGIARDIAQQGIILQISGKGAALAADLWAAAPLLRRQGWRATRVDVAFDFFEGLDWSALARSLESPEEGGRQRRGISIIRGADGGHTLYFGARSSAWMIRIYDKAIEQRVDGPWTRLEIELKAHWAESSWDSAPRPPYPAIEKWLAFNPSLPPAWIEELKAFCQQGGGVGRRPSRRANGNNEIWWRSQILPAFRKLAASDRALAEEMLVAFMRIMDGDGAATEGD